jgi:ABC-2 type transport system ATP-binding protein
MYQDIVDFAEIEPFMDQKLKNYSSGMQVRLAFSVAIKARGDILVLDEVLAVGDEAFQKKCQDFFFEAKREEKTIILVTHSMGDIRKYCNRAMLIKDGKIAKMGKPDEVATAYSDIFVEEEAQKTAKENNSVELVKGEEVTLSKVSVVSDGRELPYLNINENFEIPIEFSCAKNIEQAVVAINLVDQAGRIALATSTKIFDQWVSLDKGSHKVIFHVENVFASGDYAINVAIADEQNLLLKQQNVYRFHIRKDKYYDQSLTHPTIRIEGV